MKKDCKFIVSAVSITLSSVLLLAGCMAVITARSDTTRPYQLSTSPQITPDAEGNPKEETIQSVLDHKETLQQPIFIVEASVDPALQETPVSQEKLKAKFSAMYDFSKGNTTISVISENYLEDFWSSNYEKEVVHSLSVSSVLYIIQDSIRIYKLLLGSFVRFSAASIASFVIDFLMLTLLANTIFAPVAHGAFFAKVLARCVSAPCNFYMNSKCVFEQKMSKKTFTRYIMLAVFIMLVSALGVDGIMNWLKFPTAIIGLVGIVVDIVLYLLSYRVQRSWVFKADK